MNCNPEKYELPEPSRMSDGRLFTDWNTRCTRVPDGTSYEHRMYLIKNASSIMKKNRCFSSEKCLEDPGTMLPEKFVVTCNNRTCTRNPTQFEDGLGDGRKAI